MRGRGTQVPSVAAASVAGAPTISEKAILKLQKLAAARCSRERYANGAWHVSCSSGGLSRSRGGGFRLTGQRERIMIMKKLAFATLVAMGMTRRCDRAAATGARANRRQRPRNSHATVHAATDAAEQSSRHRLRAAAIARSRSASRRADKNGDGRVNREEASIIDGLRLLARGHEQRRLAEPRQEYQAAMATSTPRDGAAGSAGA